MTEFKGTPWFVEIFEPDYLDGIRSGVTVYGNERRPVAYAFDEAEGRVLAAAPELLEALQEACETIQGLNRELNNHGGMIDDETFPKGLAAIAKALGEGQ